jgi:hypothetical protein
VTGEERERVESRRVWAAMMLAFDLDACESILRRLPVVAGNLDPVVLRHALRGRRLPNADSYVTVTDAMLDAVAEAEIVLIKQAGKR